MSLLKDLNGLITGSIDRNLYEIESNSRLIFINYTIENIEILHDPDSDNFEKISMNIQFDYDHWVLSFQHISDKSKTTQISSSVVYQFLKDNDAVIFDEELLTIFLLGYIND